jgi:uncharacterized Zn finger protein
MATFLNIICPNCGARGTVELLPWKYQQAFDAITARCDADCGYFGFMPLKDFVDLTAAIEDAAAKKD